MSVNEVNKQIDLTEPGDPFFFFHIPKTAGSTLVDILEDFFGYQEICPAYYTYELSSLTPTELSNFRFFRGHIDYHVLSRYLKKEPQTITFLRHPVDHAISIFSHLKRKTDEEFVEQEIQAVRQMNLEKFIFQPDRVINLDYSNLQLRTLVANSHLDLATLLPPTSNSPDVPDKALPTDQDLLEYGKELLSRFFFVGLAERFEEGLLLLSYHFGLRPLEFIPRINVSHNRPAKDTIAPEVYEQIAWKSKLDFELYKFGKELFESRFKTMTQALLAQYGTAEQQLLYAGGGETVPRELIYQWLEEHYYYRFTRRHPAVSSLDYNAEQPLNGRQWQKRERFKTFGVARWTGPGAVSVLDLPLSAESNLKISFEVVLALEEEALDTIELTVGDHPVFLFRHLSPTGTRIYEGILPQERLAESKGLVRLSFQVNKPSAANELNPDSEDDRTLGVVIKWIKVEPHLNTFSFAKPEVSEILETKETEEKITVFSKVSQFSPRELWKTTKFFFISK